MEPEALTAALAEIERAPSKASADLLREVCQAAQEALKDRPPQTTPDLAVGQAVAAVIRALPNIAKDDSSDAVPYSFRGIETIVRHVQPLFGRFGVVITPKATITDVRHSPGMKDSWTDVFMSVEWTITGPQGDTLTAVTTGVGRDNSDKGANKAQTQAFKYLLLHMLCVADGKDDADGQSYEHGRDDRAATTPPTAEEEAALAALIDLLDHAPPQVYDEMTARYREKVWGGRERAWDDCPPGWVPKITAAVEKALAEYDEAGRPFTEDSPGSGAESPGEPPEGAAAPVGAADQPDASEGLFPDG